MKSVAVNVTSDAIAYTYTINGATTNAPIALDLK